MPADRRLSDLPGDLLRHVLSFAPAKEAATTAVLSRQWRSLWRTSGAVNLDSRSYGRRFSVGMHEGFFHGAQAALGAACVPLRRLTFHVKLEAKTHGEIEKFLLSRRKECWQHDMIGAVLPSPAARRIEELHVGAHRFGWPPTVGYTGGFYKLSYGALPSEALRVLHIANCRHLTPAPPGAAFPRLAEIRLQGCGVSLKGLQGMINIAPQLVALYLECIYLSDDDEEEAKNGSPAQVKCYRLCSPAVTALVLANCTCPCEVQGGIALDVPRLRYLRFKGFICDRLSLQYHASDLDRVDLHFMDRACRGEDNARILFWQFPQNFNSTKALKLKMNYPIDDIAVVEKNDWDELLGRKFFCNLERLELEGIYEPSCEAAAFAVANLLHCCPVVRDLWLKLSKALTPSITAPHFHLIAKKRVQLDFNESVDHFKHRRISLGDDDGTYEVSDISGLLGDLSFNCLQNYLSRVSLQFRMEKPNCFGAQLVKFFAENALTLEEMYIDDGVHRICEHMSSKVGRWTASSSKRCNNSSTALLPHETVLAEREGIDRLSKLDDDVLGHILSFLPAFEAARAAALSPRWRDIFAAVHTISLDEWERPIDCTDTGYDYADMDTVTH